MEFFIVIPIGLLLVSPLLIWIFIQSQSNESSEEDLDNALKAVEDIKDIMPSEGLDTHPRT